MTQLQSDNRVQTNIQIQKALMWHNYNQTRGQANIEIQKALMWHNNISHCVDQTNIQLQEPLMHSTTDGSKNPNLATQPYKR